MHSKNMVIRALIGAMLFVVPAHAGDEILGRWDSQSRSAGGIGSMLHFGAEGTVHVTVGAMLDFTYRTEGDQLFTSNGTQTIGPVKFSVVGNKLIRGGQEAVRVGKSESGLPAIVGKWRSPHATGADTIEEFTANGDLLFRVPFRTDQGRYRVVGSKLSMQIPGRPRAYAGTFRIENGLLRITFEDDGRTESYRRIAATPIIVTDKDRARMMNRMPH